MFYSKEELLDGLSRAYKMEEEMSDTLAACALKGALPQGVSHETYEKIVAILDRIQADTEKHKAIVRTIRTLIDKE